MTEANLTLVVDAKKATQTIDNFEKKTSVLAEKAKSLTGALAGIFAVGAMASLSSGFLKAASDNAEAAQMMSDTFKGLQDTAQGAVDTLAEYLDIDMSSMQQQFAETSMVFQQMGFSLRDAIDISKDINKLGGDLAALTNYEGGATGATQALKQALMGMTKPLRSLGIVLSESQIKAQMMKNEIEGITFATNEQAKAFATYQVIMEKTADAQGQLGRERGSFQESVKRLQTELANLQGTIGDTFIKPIAEANAKFADLVGRFNKLPIEYQNLFIKGGIGSALAATAYFTAKPLLESMDEVLKTDLHEYLDEGLRGLGVAARDLGTSITIFMRTLLTRVGTLAGVIEGVAMLGGAIKGAYEGIRDNEGVFNDIKGASVGFVKGLQQGAQALFDSIGAVDALKKALLESSAKNGILSWFFGFNEWTAEDQAKQEELDRKQKARAEKIAEQEKALQREQYIDRGDYEQYLANANREVAISGMTGLEKAQAEYQVALEEYTKSLEEFNEVNNNSQSTQEQLEQAVDKHKAASIALTQSTMALKTAQDEESERLKEEQRKNISLGKTQSEVSLSGKYAGMQMSSMAQLNKLREEQAIAIQEYNSLTQEQLLSEEEQLNYQKNLISIQGQIVEAERKIDEENTQREKVLSERQKDIDNLLSSYKEESFLEKATTGEKRTYYNSQLQSVNDKISGFDKRRAEIEATTEEINALNEAIASGADTSRGALETQAKLVKRRNELEESLYKDEKELYTKRHDLEKELQGLRDEEQSELEEALAEAEDTATTPSPVAKDGGGNAVEAGTSEATQIMSRITNLYQDKMKREVADVKRNTILMNSALQKIANDDTHVLEVQA